MKFLRNADSDTLLPYILTSGLILLLSAAIVPAAAIMFIQDMLFFSHDHWTFIRPQAAYQGFAIGMVWISLVLFSLLFTKMYAEKKGKEYKLAGLHVFFFLLAVPAFVLAVFHYAYLDEDGVQVNPLWSFTEERILWDQVKEVKRTVEENTSRVLFYTFSDGDASLTIPYDSRDYKTVQAIKRAILQYNWETTDTFLDTGESLELFEGE
ncbi:hypothetical protein [Planococcus sp. CAU13]|uniref:hypothetical protein n=1 Tax=Planococcus sp. CAU13 TaxID=1541197 RepID=UPI00068F2608|nr:hypothetical protein [Planococcus sp. CAU13]